MFTWIPIHEEAIKKIVKTPFSQAELLATLAAMKQTGLLVVRLDDEGVSGQKVPLAEIDPFTFFATFNRGIAESNRQANWQFLKQRWNLAAPVPTDFHGIPTMFNMNSWFFPFAKHREPHHIPLLWELATQGFQRGAGELDAALFDRCGELDQVSLNRLSIGLYWINPNHFLPADNKTVAYGQSKALTIQPNDFASYRNWMQQMAAACQVSYPEISHAAHLFSVESAKNKAAASALKESPPEYRSRRYWTISAGKGGDQWAEFVEQGIIAINGSGLPDLTAFPDKETIRARLVDDSGEEGSKKNNAHACWQFVHELHPGDIVFAKQGHNRILGCGIVEGGYQYANDKPDYRHTRKVKWLATGGWDTPNQDKMALKALTDITPYPDSVATLSKLVGLDASPGAHSDPVPSVPPSTPASGRGYWWLNANPKIWDMEEMPVGQRQTYTSHNDKGNKRQKYRYFHEVKPGDLVVGYVTSPQKEMVAVCRITRGLHETPEGEGIEIEKMEELAAPLALDLLQSNPDLAEAEPIQSNQGSLFKLTEHEFEVIRSLIDETAPPAVRLEPYDKARAMQGLFLAATQFDEMLEALREKKNVVLQGAPGVGKTFVARRLAHALLGAKDPQRVEMIQFHQSYSYEDFIQGYRPTPKGQFELRSGVFFQFCRRAQRDESRPYVFVIDEINRGNLSKIFGELMMLIEPDKRGRDYAIPLAYSQTPDDRFYLPDNLYILGMMNTADRSLAMVDYALRRRFRFITLRPEFASAAFRETLKSAQTDGGLIKKIVDRMAALNDAIAADTRNLGAGYQIGHSFFCPRPGTPPDEAWYRRIIESEIVPLLQEYWFDNDQKVEEHRTALLA